MSSPVSKLLLPHQALAGCVFAGVYRDTRGAKLSDVDRVNHFPASPLVSVTLVLRGELVLLSGPSDMSNARRKDPAPSCFVWGPSDDPTSSWSPGEIAAISIGIYHDAWLQLGGDSNFRHVPESFQAALGHLAKVPQIEQGWDAFCDELEEHWARLHPKGWRGVWGIADWAQATVTRAALAQTGQSLRSVQRHLKRMSGQTRRSLDFYSAFETLHQVATRNPGISLAEGAHAAGYSDQSHMGRAIRRATGFTPARLNNAIQTEEPFWCYRLLGERF